MIPTKLPCDTCLCLALCKNREKVHCDILNKMALNVEDDDEKIAIWWALVHSTLPDLSRIRGDHEHS